MNKVQISHLLRKLRIIAFFDRCRFHVEKFKNRKINRDFKRSHPGVNLPPDYLIYESFQINYRKYYSEGLETAKWLSKHLKKHSELKDDKILDWGCGPGRIIRHFPAVINNRCEFFGTDSNARSIEWCSRNIPDISFNLNSLEAKLSYADNFFDVICGISVFTHLSEHLHYEWRNELLRILKPNGILFLTTQGDNFIVKLTASEISRYNRGELIVRGNVKEGGRTFSAFHPSVFIKNLFTNVEIIEHITPIPEAGKEPPQDIWIIKKT